MPLAFGLVPEQDRPLVIKKLIERIRTTDKSRLDTGGYGTRYIGDVLVEAGEADLLVELFTQKECPGFGYMAAQGATTLWEQWPFKCMMDTHNHAFRSGAASCLYTHIAGIRPAKPGYAEIVVCPAFPSQVESLEAVRMTPRGRVKIAWKKSGASVRLNVTVPPFTRSRLVLPGGVAADLRPGETNSFDLDPTGTTGVPPVGGANPLGQRASRPLGGVGGRGIRRSCQLERARCPFSQALRRERARCPFSQGRPPPDNWLCCGIVIASGI